jgi:hypothetical protein
MPVPERVPATTFGPSGQPLSGASLWMETELVVATIGHGISGADGRYLVTDLSPFHAYRFAQPPVEIPDGADPAREHRILTRRPRGPAVDTEFGRRVPPGSGCARSAKDSFVFDIPLAAYRVTAVITGPDGRRTPLLVTRTGETPVAVGNFQFEPEEWPAGCAGSSTGSGIGRGFPDVELP